MAELGETSGAANEYDSSVVASTLRATAGVQGRGGNKSVSSLSRVRQGKGTLGNGYALTRGTICRG